TGTERLLLLPIPRPMMHIIDVAAGLADPWLLFIVPGLVLLGVGLALGGRAVAGLLSLIAGMALLLTLAAASALVSFTLQWVLRDRRRGEAMAIVLTMALAFLGLLPPLLISSIASNTHGPPEVRVHLPTLWLRPLPSEMYTWSLRAGL